MSAWNPVGMLELFFPILSTLCHKVDIGTVRSHVFLRSVLIFLLIRLHLVIYMIHNALLTVPYDSYDSWCPFDCTLWLLSSVILVICDCYDLLFQKSLFIEWFPGLSNHRFVIWEICYSWNMWSWWLIILTFHDFTEWDFYTARLAKIVVFFHLCDYHPLQNDFFEVRRIPENVLWGFPRKVDFLK